VRGIYATGSIVQLDAMPLVENHSAVLNPYGLTGREWDVEMGIYYLRNRYYNPDIGKFIQDDPLGVTNDPNLSSYVDNNPINFSDPSGLLKLIFDADRDIISVYSDTNQLLHEYEARADVDTTAEHGELSSKKYNVGMPIATHDRRFGDLKIPIQGNIPGGMTNVLIHGGGSGATDPFAPDQELRPTMGCLRMKNRTMGGLGRFVRNAKRRGEGVTINVNNPRPKKSGERWRGRNRRDGWRAGDRRQRR
jgi:RHS repeat-associated protein